MQGELAVECCLALINELAAVSEQQPVLLAVDDYNALYWTTEYGRTLFREPDNGPAYSVRKPLQVEQLNLVSAEQPPTLLPRRLFLAPPLPTCPHPPTITTTTTTTTIFREPQDGPAYSVHKPLQVHQLHLVGAMLPLSAPPPPRAVQLLLSSTTTPSLPPLPALTSPPPSTSSAGSSTLLVKLSVCSGC